MDYAAARHNMVESQIRTNKVIDRRVIDRLETVPRELFVPPAQRSVAYVDEGLPLGGGRYLTEPMVLARMLQAMAVKPTDIVLVVGGASGYAAALLAGLAQQVIVLESDPALAAQARKNLSELGLALPQIVVGPLDQGMPAHAPYDAILIDGAVARLPDAYGLQLSSGGRLLYLLKPAAGVGKAVLAQNFNGTLSTRVLFDAATPLLPDFDPVEGFVF